jgi:hypothetical protein
MASNSELFGTDMTSYREKQILQMFIDVIEISPLGYLDPELKMDIKFYARFLVIMGLK